MAERTKLLVSVRSKAEAQVALAGGADIIDIKEPAHGSLGAASIETVRSISEIVARQAPLSVALGEWWQTARPSLPENIAWAKLGFSQCRSAHDRRRAWKHWLQTQSLLQTTRLIGVVYADRLQVSGPGVAHVLEWIQSTRHASPHAPGLLIDTAIKDGRGLFTWLSVRQLCHIQCLCRNHGVQLALAGSLTFADVRALMKHVQPDVIAVRGAACAGGVRASLVQADRVRSLRQCLQADS